LSEVTIDPDWDSTTGISAAALPSRRVDWPSGDTVAILEAFFVLGAVVVVGIPVMVCLWREGGWLDRRRQRRTSDWK
jgi:hypothetical protein